MEKIDRRGNRKGLTFVEYFGSERAKDVGRKISEAKKGKEVSFETRRKLSECNKGKKRSKETRKIPWNKELTKETDERVSKYAEKLKGKSVPKKTKQAISKTLKLYFKTHDAPMKGKESYLKGHTYEECFGEEQAKILKRNLSNLYTGEKHFRWKGGIKQYPYGYNWKEQRQKVLELYEYKSAISNKNAIHVHHIIPRSKYFQFIYNDDFFSNFESYTKYLPRILFSYTIPNVLINEMNKLDNLIVLTNSEHMKYEGNSLSFFKEYKRGKGDEDCIID